MEQIVTGCTDCPFRGEVEHDLFDDEGDFDGTRIQYYCRHPKRYLVDLLDLGDGVITPSDCPLYKEPITISLKQE